ncbi:cell wall-binding repeat-containing protein [Halobacillus salinarum]|uniref:beta-glucosidase n=1 Tax=Halobacillus salinarum TaxID=2932257 RepID=A0ABY4ENB8_9BACI|nr:glycoside hydrolase family 3 N-terminal domain-containing protein [Halobacillus salinarum]UOQ45953.1 cell wall-binding repeat-containing protein [Halobacillus salinarum]
MRVTKLFSICIMILLLIMSQSAAVFASTNQEPQKSNPSSDYMNPDLPIPDRVRSLLSQMTLEEKVGQMTQINVTRLMGDGAWDQGDLNEATLKKVLVDNHAGSILSGGGASPIPNNAEEWAKMTNKVQKYAIEHTRLHIPIIYGVDAVHGHNNVMGATIFPHNIGMGATWDTELAKKTAASTSKAVEATGINWNFAPVLDVARDIRWGRYYEAYSEDPLLVTELGNAAIQGIQQDEEKGTLQMAASAKHFLGYSASETGHDRTPADISTRTLRNTFLPPFKRAVKNDVATIMVNSSSVNGIPVHSSHYLLTDLLRKQLGYKGVVVSDWQDIQYLVDEYHIADTYKEAIKISINAGVDMSMVPIEAEPFTSNLIDLVKEGKVSEKRINEAVSRILTLKFKLGLFEEPYVDASQAIEKVNNQDRDLAYQAAAESLTLLKNENQTLPLDKNIDSLYVTGPSANSVENQMGGWTIGWQGIPENSDELPPAVTVLEGIKKTVSSNTRVTFDEGKDLQKARQSAENADAVVIVVGEKPYAEGEGDTETGQLPEAQQELFQAVQKSGTPVIVVTVAGRPLIMNDIVKNTNAFLMAYLPGTEGGSAIADTLFGNYNPSGELAVSWPKRIGDVPMNYMQYPGPNGGESSDYDPLFAFGAGLSYTTFDYSNLNVSDHVNKEGNVKVQVDVTNSGSRAGEEVVQAYTDNAADYVLTPPKKLQGFKRVSLDPGETKTVQLDFPASQLSVITGDVLGNSERFVYPGEYTLMSGDQTAAFTVDPEKDEPQINKRLAGKDRYQTAIEISQEGWDKAENVIIARGDNFADALSGSPLAYKLDAPILLTKTDRLLPEVKEEIKRLGAEHAIVLGGPNAVSSYAEYQVEGLGVNVDRVKGKDRYGTAAHIAARLDGHPDKAIVANGNKFPDALSAAPYAAKHGFPILLTKSNKLPKSTKEALQEVPKTVVVGGDSVVNGDVFSQLPEAERYNGKNRYETSAVIAQELESSADAAFVSTGSKFADALTGSVLAAKRNGVSLLVEENQVPKEVKKAYQNLNIEHLYILGGPNAVSERVRQELWQD